MLATSGGSFQSYRGVAALVAEDSVELTNVGNCRRPNGPYEAASVYTQPLFIY